VSPEIERERVIAAIRNAPAPVVNTTYLEDEFDVSRESLHERLSELVADGVLEHTEARGRGHLWWLSVTNELDE
jgi:DNA-binding GntR family transcriptional regulator